MALSPGTQLGPYEILALIGKGGMGEVYRARDTRLGRDVAIKVSTEQFTERFEREARAVAALNHPNICTLHDVGPNYLVMEFIDGESPRGPLPLDEALRIARQIADALDAAHERGIVHRDLKPGNIKIKPDGTVKVLDFGLAKVGGTPAVKGEDSPTLSMAATQAGMILGTAGYMSPEQARGKEVDKRADIWAFGVVFYELLTGKRLFEGEDIGHTLAAVIMQEPDLSAVPGKVRRMLGRCLAKDPKKRLRDIGDVWELLEERPPDQSPAPIARRSWAPWAGAAALAIVAAGLGFVHFREKAPPAPEPVFFQIATPENTVINALSVSPDGRHVIFTTRNLGGGMRLWIRSFGTSETKLLGAAATGSPFWSPDSHHIAFVTLDFPAKLKKIDVTGGPAQTICDLPPGFRGAAWNPAGVIVFGSVRNGLMQVPANGGIPSALTLLDHPGFTDFHGAPSFLPDGRRFLYLRHTTPENSGIFLGSLDSKPDQQSAQRLLPADSVPLYTPSDNGQILFEREGSLMAQRFDAGQLKLIGETVRIADNVPRGLQPYYSVSDNGALAYEADAPNASNSHLLWYDRQGKQVGEFGPASNYNDVALSPDGKKIVVDKPTSTGYDVWTADVARPVFSRVNAGEASDMSAAISHDYRLAYSSTLNGAIGDIYASQVNGVGAPELWVKSPLVKHPNRFSSDGRFLIYDVHDPQRRQDLWVIPTSGDRKPIPFLTTPADETFGQFSPDGKWIAYDSDESGRREVYVQGFVPDHVPASGVGKWLISAAGGSRPRWRRDGKELYYLALDGKMMAAPVKSSSGFEPGIPVPLFETHTVGFFSYDVSPDGRFLINTPTESNASSTPITVVLNWTGLLKK